MQIVRVFHIPNQIPYTQKIVSSYLHSVTIHEGIGSRSLYWQRLFLPAELDAFDVLHIHGLRDGTAQGMKNLLEQCKSMGKGVIYTAHDLHSLRQDEAVHCEKLRLVCALADAVITLTDGCAEKVFQLVGDSGLKEKVSIIPHGFAVHPHHAGWGISGSSEKTVQYAIYGGFRHNRDLLGFARAWYSSFKQADAQLNVLLRTPDEVLAEDPHLRVAETLAFLRSDPQYMRVLLAPSFTDEQILRFLSRNDILVMPYLWGTHSGQLEMAFDLKLLPLMTRVGFFSEQWNRVCSHVPEPVWFDWPDLSQGHTRLRAILQEAQARRREQYTRQFSREWKSYRLWEHQQFLQAHYQIYTGARKVNLSLLPDAAIRTGGRDLVNDNAAQIAD